MKQYLNTLLIASLTFLIGNFIGQALDRVIFRDDYSQIISHQILSQDSETIQSYWLAIEH